MNWIRPSRLAPPRPGSRSRPQRCDPAGAPIRTSRSGPANALALDWAGRLRPHHVLTRTRVGATDPETNRRRTACAAGWQDVTRDGDRCVGGDPRGASALAAPQGAVSRRTYRREDRTPPARTFREHAPVLGEYTAACSEYLYARHEWLTVAHDRVAVEAMVSGEATHQARPAQRASAMASRFSHAESASLSDRRRARMFSA